VHRTAVRDDGEFYLPAPSVANAYPIRTTARSPMLKALNRHPWRRAPAFHDQGTGYETLVTHVFRDGDKYLDSERCSACVPL